jgi:mannose-6-phosphate isomerase-like protein (cupin superfamily)
MSRCGDVFENRATGEYAVILRGSGDRGDGPILAHLLVRPGGAVTGEHVHPYLNERFTVLGGRLDARVNGRRMSLGPGQSVLVEARVAHDWWNASTTEDAHVLVEIAAAPATRDGRVDVGRFELMIANLFGLANDGKLDRHQRPPLLHAAVFAREFFDMIVFTRPPAIVQRVLFALMAPVGQRLGYRAIEPRYARPHGHVPPEPWALAAAGLPVTLPGDASLAKEDARRLA